MASAMATAKAGAEQGVVMACMWVWRHAAALWRQAAATTTTTTRATPGATRCRSQHWQVAHGCLCAVDVLLAAASARGRRSVELLLHSCTHAPLRLVVGPPVTRLRHDDEREREREY